MVLEVRRLKQFCWAVLLLGIPFQGLPRCWGSFLLDLSQQPSTSFPPDVLLPSHMDRRTP